jgi:hypothetical protein
MSRLLVPVSSSSIGTVVSSFFRVARTSSQIRSFRNAPVPIGASLNSMASIDGNGLVCRHYSQLFSCSCCCCFRIVVSVFLSSWFDRCVASVLNQFNVAGSFATPTFASYLHINVASLYCSRDSSFIFGGTLSQSFTSLNLSTGVYRSINPISSICCWG